VTGSAPQRMMSSGREEMTMKPKPAIEEAPPKDAKPRGGFLVVDGKARPLSPEVMAALRRWRPESRSMRSGDGGRAS